MKHIIDDGFNSELVSSAFFDGHLEIPIIEKPKEIIVPSALIPFTQIKRSSTKSEAVVPLVSPAIIRCAPEDTVSSDFAYAASLGIRQRPFTYIVPLASLPPMVSVPD